MCLRVVLVRTPLSPLRLRCAECLHGGHPVASWDYRRRVGDPFPGRPVWATEGGSAPLFMPLDVRAAGTRATDIPYAERPIPFLPPFVLAGRFSLQLWRVRCKK